MLAQNSNIVSVDWLRQNSHIKNLVILDATMKKTPSGQFIPVAKDYVPGALEFNFDTQVCDQNTELPHMLPSPEEFEKAAQSLGIDQDTQIVCYDAMGIFSSPRAWWMFKVMGHEKVQVLDGGLPEWKRAGLPTQEYWSLPERSGNFTANFNTSRVFSSDQVLAAIDNPKAQVIDARSKARFYGEEPEPRKDLIGGHIPGSYCLPFSDLLVDGVFQKKELLARTLETVIKSENEQLIFSCGSGVTASILALVADELGFENAAVYDGSWSEWGLNGNLPVVST